MYSFQNNFLLSILLYIFVTSTFSDSNLLTNRPKRGNSSNITVKSKDNLPYNNAQKATPILSKSNHSESPNLTQVVSEGGIISSTVGTHNGRENVLENPPPKTVTNKTIQVNNLTHSEDIKPVHESVISALDVAPQQDDEKPSVPKKGVNFPDSDTQFKSYSINTTNEIKLNGSTVTNVSNITNIGNKMSNTSSNIISNHISSTNTTVKHKKPLVTESDSDFINLSKSSENASKENTISIDQIDPLLVDRKSKRSDYIVPIVAVILSVPLVAILASILYKKGTYWWQHRNYKRMDFLIEGMYHN